jgi:hypothetical protein
MLCGLHLFFQLECVCYRKSAIFGKTLDLCAETKGKAIPVTGREGP